MKLEGYINLGVATAGDAPNNSMFLDVADNLLKKKDNSGVVSELGGGGALTAYKTTDETKTNDNTLVIDTDLQLELEASSVYLIKAYISQNSAAAADFYFTLNYDDTYEFGKWYYDQDNASAGLLAFGFNWTSTGSSSDKSMNLTIHVITTNAGTFGLEWCQATSDAGATILKKGSSLIATKLN
jgi:hypothetical protein